MSPASSSGGDPVVSALVVLEHGPTADDAARAANADELRAPQALVDTVSGAFRNLGFQTHRAVGNSFAIDAPRSTFERVFAAKLSVGADGAVTVAGAGGRRGAFELPLQALPRDLRRAVRAVMFSEPPAFGPGGSGP